MTHRLAGHLQEGEEQQQDDWDKVQQLHHWVHRLPGCLLLLLPRLPPRPWWHPAKVRPEYGTPASGRRMSSCSACTSHHKASQKNTATWRQEPTDFGPEISYRSRIDFRALSGSHQWPSCEHPCGIRSHDYPQVSLSVCTISSLATSR